MRGMISVLGREQLGQLLFDVSPEAVSIADHERTNSRGESGVLPRHRLRRRTKPWVDSLDFNGSGEQDDRFFESMRSDLAQSGKWAGEIWQRRKTGEAYAEKVTRVRIDDESGRRLRIPHRVDGPVRQQGR